MVQMEPVDEKVNGYKWINLPLSVISGLIEMLQLNESSIPARDTQKTALLLDESLQ